MTGSLGTAAGTLLVVGALLLFLLALVLAAPLIALEVNMLRVAGIGAGVETLGYTASATLKDWMGWGALGLGVGQVVGLGWWASRKGTASRAI